MAPETLEQLCQQAQEALAQGRYEEARQLYTQALGIRADLPHIHHGLGTACFLLNDLASAAHHFKEVIHLDPLRASAYINLGAVYNRLGQIDEAIAVLRRGIQLDRTRAEGYYNLGLAYRRKGQLDLAIGAYQEATRLNPRMADAHYNLANLYLEKGNFALAADHYRQVLEIRPGWEKAERGLQQAEAGLRTKAPSSTEVPATGTTEQAAGSAATAPAEPLPPPDPERTVDPQLHGPLLTTLHRATIESEELGRNLLLVLQEEIEPAIKALSACLLYPSISLVELDQCMQRMETAIASLRNAQRGLQSSMEKVRLHGEKLLRS